MLHRCNEIAYMVAAKGKKAKRSLMLGLFGNH
jgi:hypothetical protein